MDHHSYFNSQSSTVILKHDGASVDSRNRWKQMGEDEKKIAVQEEIKKMNKLPSNSSYASHRLRVLNKILQLMSVQRSASVDEELELLFAGLSI